MTPVPCLLPTVFCALRTASSSARSAAPRASRRSMSWHAPERGRQMPKADSSFSMLIVAAMAALGIGYYVPQLFSHKPVATTTATAAESPKVAPAPRPVWAASAPGRVEPASGEIRMSAQVPGRIADVLVGVNDKISAGDLLVRLADEDLVARVNAARAEVAVRKRDRDNESVSKAAQDRRNAEDKVADAERQLSFAREDLDRALR